jgi:hypothetical protein
MTDNPTSKSGKPAERLRIDEEQGLIFIPGQDQPKELIAPIQQRIDAKTGLPYQHVVSATELLAAEEQHQRCMRFFRDVMRTDWKCIQCGAIRPGTELRASQNLLEVIAGMLAPGGTRVDWGSIVEHLTGHLRCKNPKCDAPCRPVNMGETA